MARRMDGISLFEMLRQRAVESVWRDLQKDAAFEMGMSRLAPELLTAPLYSQDAPQSSMLDLSRMVISSMLYQYSDDNGETAVRALYVAALYLWCYTEVGAHDSEVPLACGVMANAALADNDVIDESVRLETVRFLRERVSRVKDDGYAPRTCMMLVVTFIMQRLMRDACDATIRFAAEEHEEFNELWCGGPGTDVGTHMLKTLNAKLDTGLFTESDR